MAFCMRFFAVTVSSLLAAPSMACDLDGFLHGRFTPFGPAGAMHSGYLAAQAQASPAPAQSASIESPSGVPEASSIEEQAQDNSPGEEDTADPSRSSPLP